MGPLWEICPLDVGVSLRLFVASAPRSLSSIVKSQRSAGPAQTGAGAPLSFSAPQNEGSRAPTGAGAETPHPMTCLAGEVASPDAGDRRPMTRAGAPFGALLRRSHYGVGPRFVEAKLPHRSSASSWQEAVVPPGGAPTPPGCPADEAGARRRRTSHEARNCRAPAAGLRTCSPVPPPACSAIKNAPDGAPRRARREKNKCGSARGDKLFSKTYPREKRAEFRHRLDQISRKPRLELSEREPLQIGLRGARRPHDGDLGAGRGIDRHDLDRAAESDELEIDFARRISPALRFDDHVVVLDADRKRLGLVWAFDQPRALLDRDRVFPRPQRAADRTRTCPVRMSNSHECHGQRMISPRRE